MIYHELDLPGGRTVRFREMSGEDLESMTRTTPADASAFDVVQNGLRRTLVQIGDAEVEYKDLVGPLLSRHFSAKELLMVRAAWEHVHSPGPEDMVRVKTMRVVAG
ncbi:MAG: hypothetical protein ABL912_01875 [Novosphingobium sp.]